MRAAAAHSGTRWIEAIPSRRRVHHRDDDEAPALRGGPTMMRIMATMMCIARIVAAHHPRPAPRTSPERERSSRAGARPGEGAAVAAEPAQSSAPRPGPSPLPLSRSGEGFQVRPSLLLPLVGRTDSAEGRARRGAPGMEHLTGEGLKVRQPQGPGLTDHGGLAPAADARRAGLDREPYARRPPPCPPPQGGRGIARRLCENPISRSGEGFSSRRAERPDVARTKAALRAQV